MGRGPRPTARERYGRAQARGRDGTSPERNTSTRYAVISTTASVASACGEADRHDLPTAASLARKHRKAHNGIDDADYLIAATTIVCDGELLTTNVRHFPMFPGLAAPY
jgi:hypothetical protein